MPREAVAEATKIGEQCGIHVQIAHMKLSGTDSWGEADRLLAAIDARAADGPYFSPLSASVAGAPGSGRHLLPWAWAAMRCLVTAMAASATLLPWTFAMMAALTPLISSTLLAAR